MHSRGEVRSFLQSCASYWLSKYHIDGLRMDAVSRAIYWQGDPARGVNSNAVDFIRYMNQGLKKLYPTAILRRGGFYFFSQSHGTCRGRRPWL